MKPKIFKTVGTDRKKRQWPAVVFGLDSSHSAIISDSSHQSHIDNEFGLPNNNNWFFLYFLGENNNWPSWNRILYSCVFFIEDRHPFCRCWAKESFLVTSFIQNWRIIFNWRRRRLPTIFPIAGFNLQECLAVAPGSRPFLELLPGNKKMLAIRTTILNPPHL